MSAPQPTPGPWRVMDKPSANCGTDWRDVVTDALPFAPSFVCAALADDAALIASAPALAAECERLRAERDALRAACESARIALEHPASDNWRDTALADLRAALNQ